MKQSLLFGHFDKTYLKIMITPNKGLELKSNLNIFLMYVKNNIAKEKIIEKTFVEIFGQNYLLEFDEFDFNLEKFMICFCKNNNIHLTKTSVSYIFSIYPLNFKRKYVEVPLS